MIYWSLFILMAIIILLVIGFYLGKKKGLEQEEEKPFGNNTTARILSKHGVDKAPRQKNIKNEKDDPNQM